MNGHHLAVHGQWGVDVGSAATTTRHGLDGDKVGLLLLLLLLRMVLLIFVLLLQSFHLHLQGGNSFAVQASLCDAAMLERTAIEAGLVAIVARTNHLSTTHDNSAVTIMEGRLGSLLKAQSQIIVRLHGC